MNRKSQMPTDKGACRGHFRQKKPLYASRSPKLIHDKHTMWFSPKHRTSSTARWSLSCCPDTPQLVKVPVMDASGGRNRGVDWLLESWLVTRLAHKLDELENEFRRNDKRSNDYHFKDCCDIVDDLWRGLEILKRIKNPKSELKVLIAHCAHLHNHLQHGLCQPCANKPRNQDFVDEMKQLLQDASSCAKCESKFNPGKCAECKLIYANKP